jgi:5-methylcytosine-specific restriction endonuclease McrA
MSGKRKSLKHLLPEIIERDGGEWKCHYCGRALIPSTARKWMPPYYRAEEIFVRGDFKTVCVPCDGFTEPVVDHKHPRSRGGSDELDNLVASCWKCNHEKLTTPYDEYLKGRAHK